MFINNSERKKRKLTECLEFQICRRYETLDLLISVKNIKKWNQESVYIDFENLEMFVHVYFDYFSECIHSDKTQGDIDIYGINYISTTKTLDAIKIINEKKPKNYEEMLVFLEKANENNGFYILGM